jgi:hypothetical protein
LEAHKDWAAIREEPVGGEGPMLAERYEELLHALISYRDPKSVGLLLSIMSDQRNNRVTRVILDELANLTDSSRLTQDPFVMGFRHFALSRLNDQWGDERQNLREPALILAVRTSSNRIDSEKLLQSGLRDPSVYIRLKAAEEAATLGIKTLTPNIREAYRLAPAHLKSYFCEAIERMASTCS